MQVSFKSTNLVNNVNNGVQQNKTPLAVEQKTASEQQVPVSEQKVYASNLAAAGINFKSHFSDEDKTLEDLKNEYTWYINHDGTRPLDSLEKIKGNREKMNELFTSILQDDKLSYALIDDIAGRPREMFDNYRKLRDQMGTDSMNLKFYFPDVPYNEAFQKYMDYRVKNAKSVDEFIALRPDWKEEALIDKYEEIHGDRSLKIGKLPEDLQNGKFETIYKHLEKYKQTTGSKRHQKIEPLVIDGETYEFEFFADGRSDKNVFGVYTPKNKYVFKTAEPFRKGLNKPYTLGSLALIDGYLTANKCRNNTPFIYYDHDNNVSVYAYQEHSKVKNKIDSIVAINKFMPDFSNLGMHYMDTVGNNNYFLSDIPCDAGKDFLGFSLPDRELISVDNDHVTYSSPFMIATKYNCPLPTAMQTAV